MQRRQRAKTKRQTKRIRQQTARTKTRAMFVMIWTAVVGFLSIVGGLCVYFYLIPNVDVLPALPVPSGRIFPESFSLKNDGYLTIYPVGISAVIRSGRDAQDNSFKNVGFDLNTVSRVHIELRRGESADFPLPKFIGIAATNSLVEADVLCTVKFGQWGWPRPIEKKVKIAIWKDQDGKPRFAKPPLTDEDRKFR